MLRGASLRSNITEDNLLLACIRRVNLDSFWSRAITLVESNARRVRDSIGLSKLVRLKGPYVSTRPFSTYDFCSY